MLNNFEIGMVVFKIVTLLIAVTFHEVAHGLAAYLQGDPTAKNEGRLTLNPVKHIDPFGSIVLPAILALTNSPIIFGYAKPVPVNYHNLNHSKKAIIIVSAAGVAANAALALLAGLIIRGVAFFYGHGELFSMVALYNFLEIFLRINIILLVFNLIPVPPLDGSRIVGELLPPDLKNSYMSIERYGIFIVFGLIATGVIDPFFKFTINPLINLFSGLHF